MFGLWCIFSFTFVPNVVMVESSLKSLPKNDCPNENWCLTFGVDYLINWSNWLNDILATANIFLKWHPHSIGQLLLYYLILGPSNLISDFAHALLENRRICVVEEKYMQSVLHFFIITVAIYPKGRLSTKDSNQIVSFPIDIYLYILATMLFPHDTFLYDMHTRRYHFCIGIKMFFCVTQTFCWLKSTLIERKLSQSSWLVGIWSFVVLESITNFYPLASPKKNIYIYCLGACVFLYRYLCECQQISYWKKKSVIKKVIIIKIKISCQHI